MDVFDFQPVSDSSSSVEKQIRGLMIRLFVAFLLLSTGLWAQSVTPGGSTSGGSPGGAAGGALTGTYPNPGLANTVGTGNVLLTVPCVSGVEIYSSLSIPGCSTSLPSGLALGTPASGVATNLTGTAAGLTAGSATNLGGGSANNIPYQTGPGVTGFLASCNNGVYSTNGSSVPGCGTTLPVGLTIPGYDVLACVGAPGNTTGNYRQQCQTTAGVIYACNNVAGCTVAGDWVVGGGGVGPVGPVGSSASVNITASTSGAVTLTHNFGTVTHSVGPCIDNVTGGTVFGWYVTWPLGLNADTLNFPTSLPNATTCYATSGGGSSTITLGTTPISGGSANGVLIQSASGSTVGQVTTGNNGVLVTSGGGVPSISTTLPTGLALQTPASGEIKSTTINGATHAGIFSCEILDNAICTSAVDASGNPNFLATAAGVVLPINGGTTPLVMFIAGVYQNLNTNVTLTVPSTASVQQWILALQDTTNSSMVAGDFEAMNTAPFYQYTAPTCPSPSPALSSTNPSFWYDLSTNLSKLCTTNGGSYVATASMVVGTIYIDATPKVLQILTEPFRLNPYTRFQLFGNGSDGVLTVTSGTTTLDSHKKYQSVLVTAGTINHTIAINNNTTGISLYSQNPVMILGSSTITANGLGRAGAAGSATGGASVSIIAGHGGAGGGGGGSGTTSAAGGSGGGLAVWASSGGGAAGGGSAGTSAPTAGGNGSTTVTLPPQTNYLLGCTGGGGGAGAGDSSNAGGGGGAGGGSIFFQMPSLLVISTASVTANGVNGSNGAAGNAGAGGGGGGGCVVLDAGFLSTSGSTITASGGTGGTGQSTGRNGGNGGTGVVQQNKLW